MSFSDFFVQDADVQNIIGKHCRDFTYNSFPEFIKAQGGYKKYVRSLGGVFEKYADFTGKITTKAQLKEVLDYVWGLYNIWGVDYSNGCSYVFEENRYKAKCGCSGAFYPSKAPTSRFNMNYSAMGFANGTDLPGIDTMLSSSKYYAVCNCGQGVIQALKKAGLVPQYFPDPATYPAYYRANGFDYKIIRKPADLQVGDILLFTNKPIEFRSTRESLPNWMDGFFHTAIVGKRDSQYIYMYDSGHAFTYYGECINRRKIGDPKVYQWAADWIGIRLDCIAALSDTPEGWVKKDGHWFYYRDGKALIGWHQIVWKGAKRWFFFEDNGAMITGWKKLTWSKGQNWFYFDSTGVMVTGWRKIKEKWYCFDENGCMLTGLHRLEWNGKKDFYLFSRDGDMIKGNHTVKATFNDSGALTGGTT